MVENVCNDDDLMFLLRICMRIHELFIVTNDNFQNGQL